MQPNEERLELLLPLYWLPPEAWRTRFEAIRWDLASDGPLATGLREVRTISERSGDLAGQEATRALCALRPDLLPGEAGQEVAWSIACGSPLAPYRQAEAYELERPETQTRDIFAAEPPPYVAPVRLGGKNRYHARHLRRPELIEKLLGRLMGDIDHPPATFRDAAWLINRSTTQLHKTLNKLRQNHGIGTRSAEEQKIAHNLLSAAGKKRSGRKEKLVRLRAYEAESRTGHSVEMLKTTYGCPSVRIGKVGHDELEEYIDVPASFLVFPEAYLVAPPPIDRIPGSNEP